MHLVTSGLPFKRTAAEEVTAHCPCLLSNVSFFVHSCGVLSLELIIDGAGNVGKEPSVSATTDRFVDVFFQHSC